MTNDIDNLKSRITQLEYQLERFQTTEQQSQEWTSIMRSARAWREAEVPQIVEVDGQKRWIIVLNDYQRNNLLWLFAAIGYAKDTKGCSGIKPFTFANNGDWCGEIPLMLVEPNEPCVLKSNEMTNDSLDNLKDRIEKWKVDDNI